MSSAREGRARNTCPGHLAGHSCPQFSPCASANKASPSGDPVRCIWLVTIWPVLPSQAAMMFGHLLDLIDKWREDSAGWSYLCHSCVQGCLDSCTAEKARVAPGTELLHLGSSSSLKGKAMQAAPFPCQGTSILIFLCEKQLLSALPNRCKPHASGGI